MSDELSCTNSAIDADHEHVPGDDERDVSSGDQIPKTAPKLVPKENKVEDLGGILVYDSQKIIKGN
jgi:hypothetical protein